MKKNKIFVACDSTNISKIKIFISKTQNSKESFLIKSLERGALNPNSVLCTDQAP